jgi:hypothetical protein
MKPPTFHQFVENHRLRVKRDKCHDAIVPGILGHLSNRVLSAGASYEHDASRFGIVLSTLRSRKRRAIAAGFLLRQEGDSEAILCFDSVETSQARLAIRLIQTKKIRRVAQPTDAQLRARALFSSKARSRKPCFDQNTSAVLGHGDE